MSWQSKLARYLSLGIVVILLLIPFHGFITTWLGSSLGGLLIWRAWKEILLVLMSLSSLILVVGDRRLRSFLRRDRLLKWIVVFGIWLVVVSLFTVRDLDAFALGTAIYMRLFAVYAVALISGFYIKPSKWGKFSLEKLIVIPMAVVVIFGLLQMTVLPHDFLSHFGYQKDVTIPPYFMIDGQLDKLRIISTTRGPNSLGIYLILPIILLVDIIRRRWVKITKPGEFKKQLLLPCLLLMGSTAVLYGSHSRSGWLGLGLGLLVYFAIKSPDHLKKRILPIAAATAILLAAAIGVFRNTALVRDVVFHDNPETGAAISSNDERRSALSAGVDDVLDRPLLGCGAGCAGPASFHHENGVRVSENSYLQAAQELGLIGLGILLVIGGLVIGRLWRLDDQRAPILLASFFGISLAGVFMHAWADDIAATMWWIVFSLVVSKNRRGIIKES